MRESEGPCTVAWAAAALGRPTRQAPARTTAATRPRDARGCIARRILPRFVECRHFRLPPATFWHRHTSHSVAPLPSRFIHAPLATVFPLAATALAAQQSPDTPPDSARVARVLALLKPADS